MRRFVLSWLLIALIGAPHVASSSVQKGRSLIRGGLSASGGGGGGSVDLSEYRTVTYGATEFYCDPTRSLASAGTGSSGDPWNLNQCQSEPDCGDVVGILPVGAGTPVDLAAPNDSAADEPAFDPDGVTDCTAGNRLVYVARYAAITLDRSTIASNQNRSEIRHAGTADAADVVGTGGPVVGVHDHNYVTYDGLFIDMNEAEITGDGGAVKCHSSTGFTFRNFVIKGTTTDVDSNAGMMASEICTDETIANGLMFDFDNAPTGGGLNQDGEAMFAYGDQNYTWEHLTIDNTDRGPFPKGTATGGTVFNYGTIRYVVVKNVITCYTFNDFDPVQTTTFQYSLCHDYSLQGIQLAHLTSQIRNFTIDHVTVADGPCTSGNCSGALYIKHCTSATECASGADDGTMSGVSITNNIFDVTNGNGVARNIDAEIFIGTFATLNYNGYYRGGSALSHSYNGNTYTSTGTDISTWKVGSGNKEANSVGFTSEIFTNRAGNVFTVTGGALTASSTGGQIGCYATSETIGIITS